jgi:hypothetical protein
MNKPLIIELLAGPGAGKSTTALGLSYYFKLAGVNIEYLSEYAKDLTWRGDNHTLALQPYVTVKQLRNMYDLCREESDLKAIITDTSILLAMVYPGFASSDKFNEWIKETRQYFDFKTIYLVRNTDKHQYNPKGRRQTSQQATEKDDEVLQMLLEHNIEFQKVEFNGEEGVKQLFNTLMEELKTYGRI